MNTTNFQTLEKTDTESADVSQRPRGISSFWIGGIFYPVYLQMFDINAARARAAEKLVPLPAPDSEVLPEEQE